MKMRRCKKCGCFIGNEKHKCPKQWLLGKRVDREKYPKMGHFEKHSLITKKRIAQIHTGNKYRLGMKHSKESRQKISRATKENPTKYWLGKKRPDTAELMRKLMTGKKQSKETIEKRIKHGENHYNWQGGKSFDPYGIIFNNELKEQIRKRDGYTCQECGYTQKQLGYKLNIHHIDYNKRNNKLKNLISLCKSCNVKANFNREDWTNYYKEKMK